MLAATIHAVMLSACPTGHLNLFSHCFPGSVDAYCSVSFGDARTRGEVCKTAVTKIYCRQSLAIFGLEVFEQGIHTLTDFVISRWGGTAVTVKVRENAAQFLRAPAVLPVVIHDGVPEDAVEPRNDTFLIS